MDVSYLESGHNAYAVNDSLLRVMLGDAAPAPVNGVPTSAELSVGVFQLNIMAHYTPQWPTYFDPFINCWGAAEIWKKAGCWAPWFHSATRLGLPLTPAQPPLPTP